jgi:hypothetical protein
LHVTVIAPVVASWLTWMVDGWLLTMQGEPCSAARFAGGPTWLHCTAVCPFEQDAYCVSTTFNCAPLIAFAAFAE